MTEATLKELVYLTNELGRADLDYAILGEGNTSARAGDGTFWVKASGARMGSITPAGFAHLHADAVRQLLGGPVLTDQEIKSALDQAKVDPALTAHPSVETLLHAVLLQLDGVNFVGHTHPTAVNSLSCSQAFPDIYRGRLFPDEIVLCGVAPLLIPYTDPGIPLARAVKSHLEDYLETYGETPRIAIMQNHGLIAMGSSAQQVLDITAMAVKTARILLGTLAAGGPRFLSEGDVARIHTRPDEQYRKQQLGLR